MPPPVTKPSARQPPATLNAIQRREAYIGPEESKDMQADSDSAAMEEIQKTTSSNGSHASAPDVRVTLDSPNGSPRRPNTTLNRPGDRRSFSSLCSLGSAIFNGAAGVASAPQSATSSNAGSINSVISEQPPLASTPLSPSLGSAKGDAVSTATTATDPVQVTANSDTLHQGPNNTYSFDDSTDMPL
ncbi:MAG: hypothetical protein Q9164_004139 [Protoblastenia rupestris]